MHAKLREWLSSRLSSTDELTCSCSGFRLCLSRTTGVRDRHRRLGSVPQALAQQGSVELVHAAEQRRDQIQGGVNLGFATAKDVGVEVWIAHPDDRVATHGGRQR